MDENGREKKVTESYLLDAVSFTEAEARIYKELQQMISGEFSVRKIAITNYSEIIAENVGDRWFKGKLNFIIVNEETGKEKKTAQTILVFAETVEQTDKYIKEAMEGMMAPFEIASISETKIIEVFPYVEESKVVDNDEFIPVIFRRTGEAIKVMKITVTVYEDELMNQYAASELIM
jgi:hypothetical protein